MDRLPPRRLLTATPDESREMPCSMRAPVRRGEQVTRPPIDLFS